MEPAPRPDAFANGLVLSGLRSELAGPFDLTLAPGECRVIVGPSGSGKSLFLRMVADLDPNEGEVRLGGVERRTIAAPAWRRRIPYVAAESAWWADDVRDHFAADQAEAARRLTDRLGVRAGAFDGPVAELSTGERQRLAIIRALVLEPPALLLDEPSAPLDPDAAGKLDDLLKERLSRGVSILLVSHDPGQAARLGARAVHMRDRRLAEAS